MRGNVEDILECQAMCLHNCVIHCASMDITVPEEFAWKSKGVNTVPEAVPVWPAVRYISDTGQYRCTVLGLLLYIYIYI